MNKWGAVLKIFSFVCILTSVSIYTMVAYLSDADTVSNTMTVGGNHISIDEIYEQKPIVPGTKITKKVRIKNDGPNDCYVRVRAVFSDSDVGQYVQVDWNTNDWIYNEEDEFYYFTSCISKDEYSEYLFTTLQVDAMIPEHLKKDIQLIVYAESYQAEGYSHYQEAWIDYQKNIN